MRELEKVAEAFGVKFEWLGEGVEFDPPLVVLPSDLEFTSCFCDVCTKESYSWTPS